MVHGEDLGAMKEGLMYHIDKVGGWVVMHDYADV